MNTQACIDCEVADMPRTDTPAEEHLAIVVEVISELENGRLVKETVEVVKSVDFYPEGAC